MGIGFQGHIAALGVVECYDYSLDVGPWQPRGLKCSKRVIGRLSVVALSAKIITWNGKHPGRATYKVELSLSVIFF